MLNNNSQGFRLDDLSWLICFYFSAWLLLSWFLISHTIIDTIYKYSSENTSLLDKMSQEREIHMFVENKKQQKESKEEHKEMYMSDKNAEALGQVTKKKGFENLSNTDELNIKQLLQEYAEELEKEKYKQDNEKELTINILDPKTLKIVKKIFKKKSELTQIPSSYNFNYNQAFNWDKNGPPQVPTFMYKYSQYFRNMGNKIKNNWAPPGGIPISVYDNAYHSAGFAPGHISMQKFPPQAIAITFMIDDIGNVIDIKLMGSNGFKVLDTSLIEAIRDARNFSPPPKELLKNNRLILPWIFRIY